MTNAVTELLNQFKDSFDEQFPKLAQFDDGKEFYNVGIKKTKYFSTKLDKKAAVVEIFLQ